MSKASILIVDDDLSFQMYLSDFLSREGYAVDALTDGDQLLARLDSGPIPSVILLDVMLQHSDGIEII
jgi:CheY-like chemotaxis protein